MVNNGLRELTLKQFFRAAWDTSKLPWDAYEELVKHNTFVSNTIFKEQCFFAEYDILQQSKLFLFIFLFDNVMVSV